MAERTIDFVCTGHSGTYPSDGGELRVDISVKPRHVPGVVLTALHTAKVMNLPVFDLILNALDELGIEPADAVSGMTEAAAKRAELEARHV